MKLKIILFSLIFTGCMTTSIPHFQNVTTYRQGEIPKLNQKSTTDVGSTIYEKFEYQEAKTIKLSEDVNSKLANFPANTTLFVMNMDDKTVYYPTTNSSGAPGILLADGNNDQKLDQIKNIGSLKSDWDEISTPASFEETEGVAGTADGFKFELVYQGLTDNTIKVAYREFNNNLARPAFTQIVEYELNDNREGEIAFKGARIDVLDASSSTITYRVLKGINL